MLRVFVIGTSTLQSTAFDDGRPSHSCSELKESS